MITFSLISEFANQTINLYIFYFYNMKYKYFTLRSESYTTVLLLWIIVVWFTYTIIYNIQMPPTGYSRENTLQTPRSGLWKEELCVQDPCRSIWTIYNSNICDLYSKFIKSTHPLTHQASSVEPQSPAPASWAKGFSLWAGATADPPLIRLQQEPGATGRPSETKGWSESPPLGSVPSDEPSNSRRPEPLHWASEEDLWEWMQREGGTEGGEQGEHEE